MDFRFVPWKLRIKLSKHDIRILVTFAFQEIECLQDNMEELSEKCRLAVGNFTEDEDEDLELDRILMKACTPMIKKFCQVIDESLYTDDQKILPGN